MSSETRQVNTVNDFLFGSNGVTIQPLIPVLITTRQQAYRTAAWLVAMAVVLPEEDPSASFDEIRDAIEST